MVNTIKGILKWLFIRIFGLRDLDKVIKLIIKKISYKFKSNNHFGTILVSNDVQLGRWVEAMDAGEQSCPYWYSTRLFKGTEISPGINKKEEYWVGIRVTFLLPIIPIPVCSDEIVFKIGDSDNILYDCYCKYEKFHSLIDHKDEYTHCIIEDATVEFSNTKVTYNNDQIWSSYD